MSAPPGAAGAGAQAGARERERQARLFVTLGALAVAVGLGVAGTVRQDVGGMVLVLGWLLFVIGLHLFGRAASR